MCTVSWRLTATGHRLWSNRDERHTRSDAGDPERLRRGGVELLAPLDPDGGGTWIAVNEAGLTVCLVNRYHTEVDRRAATDDSDDRWISRGLLVVDLAAETELDTLDRALPPERLRRSRSFEVVALQGSRALRLLWNGARLEVCRADEPQGLLISSPLDPAGVLGARGDAFRRLVDGSDTAHDRFHRAHEPERGSYSPCMHGELARTRSLTRVAVEPDRIELHHEGDSPCLRTPATVLGL